MERGRFRYECICDLFVIMEGPVCARFGAARSGAMKDDLPLAIKEVHRMRAKCAFAQYIHWSRTSTSHEKA